jgi:molybdopterin-guanine dinucleotide biosynthesis protein A
MSDDIDHSQPTLAILAGGQGRRMGLPKSNLLISGQPILEYLLDQFSWPGKTLLITAPGLEHPPGWKRFDHEAVDPVSDQGPLRGILTALQNANTPLVITATLDMPCIRLEHLIWTVSRLTARPESLGLMFTRKLAARDQIEPFPFACRIEAADSVASHITSNRRAVHGLLDKPGFISEPAPEDWPPSIWTNLNHPQELHQFLKSR